MTTYPVYRFEPKYGRVLILSDLHWDFWDDDKRDPLFMAKPFLEGVDAVIIAGDLTNKPKVRWNLAIEYLKKYFPADKIFIFPGNHDYYQFRLDRDDRLKEIAEEAGVAFVQDAEIRAGDTRFLCATLWTDLDLAPSVYHVDAYSDKMNDYRAIRVESQAFRKCMPSDTRSRHLGHVDFLSEALEASFDGETIVVTHHAPVPEAATGDYACFYASNLKSMIKAFQPTAWYYGHTHDPLKMDVNGTHVQNVSLGYPMDITDEQAIERIAESVVEYNPSLARKLSLG